MVLTNIPANRAKKETRVIDGRTCVLEYALKPDFALIHAWEGDSEGTFATARRRAISTT
jgi:3-oxoacid CoA-transferase subunit A